MNIIEACKDSNLFRPFLADRHDEISTWFNWFAALRVMHGLRVGSHSRRAVVEQCTGRDYSSFDSEGFDTALFLTGRRSGKSRMAAIVGAYEAVLAGHETKLAKGERGVVPICAPTKYQGRIVKDYLRAIFDTPLLRDEVVNETREGFELNNGTRIEILSGDWRTIRGYTLLAAIVDEIAFFGIDDESKVKSDTELIRAIKPSLATVRGKLVCISSPYARKGWTWKTFQKNHGNNKGKVLVWNCGSRVMNETLSQSIIDEAMAEDLQAAKSEYLGEFRDDVAEFLPRSVIENLVVKGRSELVHDRHTRYSAFVDVSGGRGDDAALAIGHREGRRMILDMVRRFRPPFNPYEVCGDIARELKRYKISRVTGDNYSADFVTRAFEASGIRYRKASKPKAQLYAEFLPRMCSGEVELLDNKTLIDQLAGLERRTRSGGRDVIDHPPNGHDDVANAVAGVAEVLFTGTRVGAICFETERI